MKHRGKIRSIQRPDDFIHNADGARFYIAGTGMRSEPDGSLTDERPHGGPERPDKVE